MNKTCLENTDISCPLHQWRGEVCIVNIVLTGLQALTPLQRGMNSLQYFVKEE